MAFPTSPTNGDLHTEFGRSYQYVADTNSWQAATTPAPVNTNSTVTTFQSAADLPLVNNNPGDTTFVAENNSFRLWTGNGWFEIALANTAPTITAGANASYTLNSDGTPTVITMAATDPEGTPIIWGYQVTSGSLEDTTVTNEGGVFTVTPGTTEATFNLTFTASDGVNIDTSASSFTLEFGPSYSYTIDSLSQTGTSFLDWFGYSIAADTTSGKLAIGAVQDGDGAALIYDGSDGSHLLTLTNPSPTGANNGNYGRSVSISNSFALVGSPWTDDTSGATRGGRAHLFNASTGTLLKSWDNPNNDATAVQDYFGNSVAVSENYAAISAIGENNGSTRDYNGTVYVYSTTSPYNLLYTLYKSPPTSYDLFGWQVKISGNYLFVSGPKSYDGVWGRVFIYDLTTGNDVVTVNPGNASGLGSSIDVSGNYLVISDYAYDYGRGRLFVYTTASGNWSDVSLVRTTTYPRTDAAATYDMFPMQVAVNGTHYIGTAPDMEAGALEAGKPKGGVFVFDLATGNLISTLYKPDNVNGVTFGGGTAPATNINGQNPTTVAITGDKLWVSDYQAVVGSHTQAGKVFAWDL